MAGFTYVETPEEGEVYLFRCTVAFDRRELVGNQAKSEWRAGRVKQLVKVAGSYKKQPMVEWCDTHEAELVMPNKNEVVEITDRWIQTNKKEAQKKLQLWNRQMKMLEELQQLPVRPEK